jgi:hypothetical protein
MEADRVALIAATLPLIFFGIGGDYARPDPLHFGLLIAGGAGLGGALARTRWAGPLVIAALLGVGTLTRARAVNFPGSDVLPATNEAVRVLLAGHNPYAHVYASTIPPGAVFAYPPGEIAFYALAHLCGVPIARVEHFSSVFVLLAIVALVPLAGEGIAAVALGVVALSGDLAVRTGDGSNDTSASLVVIAAAAALAWSLATRGAAARALWFASAIGFGWAIAFKEYALPIVVFVALFLWRRDARHARGWLATVAVTVAVFVVPFFAWNPAGFITNVGGAYLYHPDAYGRNLWHDGLGTWPALAAVLRPLIPLLTPLAVLAVAVIVWMRPARTFGAAFLHGCAVVATLFVFARWTTSVYWIFLVPLIAAGVAIAVGGTLPLGERERLGAE